MNITTMSIEANRSNWLGESTVRNGPISNPPSPATRARHLPGAEGLGFEIEQAIFDMTTRNIASLAAPIRLVHGDYRTLLGRHHFPANHRIVAFLAPPWGDALSVETGLDLGRTKPPIHEIVDHFERAYPANQPSTSLRCMNIWCQGRSRTFALDSSGRNLAPTILPDLRGDTAFCSAATAGGHSGDYKGTGAGIRCENVRDYCVKKTRERHAV